MDNIINLFNKFQLQFVDKLIPGEKYTIFAINDFGFLSTLQITFFKIEYTKYAQYNHAVAITYRQKRKRNIYKSYFYENYRDCLIYKGWLTVPDNVNYDIKETNGMIIKSSKTMSCDKNQYANVLNYFKSQNILHLVDAVTMSTLKLSENNSNMKQAIINNFRSYKYLKFFASDNKNSTLDLNTIKDYNTILNDLNTFKSDMLNAGINFTYIEFSNQL